ncbi:hypothetical protein LTS08_002948 [Lithohypha guttulata]|uniref:uncharacterized protein n=1 Tax=Lithohypha guttulata TaxID=1690604 RepID=UPI002DE19DBC|nr:hypothetical protein LTR51_000398 [Lithohypha guttulata]KAK5103532.1 hypothetical protein LTS08_002948 [Lithohypha guttulata]
MASHAYNLRSRGHTPTNLRGIQGIVNSSARPANLSTKAQPISVNLQLEHVIGTTTKDPNGLSCANPNTFAYCAGSVAVLATIDEPNTITRRYYRARPAVLPLNPVSTYYTTTPNSTPTRKRRALVNSRKEQEDTIPRRTVLEDDNLRTWTARERIKTITSVSLSPDGKLLAVGETGYNPRVLIFSTSKDAGSELPLSLITEHTMGVRSVAFSPDSRFLATLGESNDGFLFIWSVHSGSGAVKLRATNKCTTTISHMAWCGHFLVTVGTRHVKVWQPPDTQRLSSQKTPRPRDTVEPSSTTGPVPLIGRNCVLGDLANMTFTCVVAINDRLAVIGTNTRSLYLVDVSKNPADLQPLSHDYCLRGVVGVREDSRRLVWAGGGSALHETLLQGDQMTMEGKPATVHSEPESLAPTRPRLHQSRSSSQPTHPQIVAISCLVKHNICVDSESNLLISLAETVQSNQDPLIHRPLASHNEPVQGVQALNLSSGLGAFFTWSKSGEIRFWDSDGDLLRIERIQLDDDSNPQETASNELNVLRYSGRNSFLSGDRFGVLKLIGCTQWKLLQTARAHSAEVSDICLDRASSFVATCSRDRMVQVFTLSDSNLELLQTTDDHIAAVNQVLFSSDGNILLSSSADRTIVVREKVVRTHGDNMLIAFLQTRIITIKASPLSICLMPNKDNIVYVSTLDRSIIKADFVIGAVVDTFKVADADSDDHAVLNSIQVVQDCEPSSARNLLIGCSSTDKSVRVYDLQKQVFLTKESAHTQGVSDIALLEADFETTSLNMRTFVSAGYDTTIMKWRLCTTSPAMPTQEQASLADTTEQTPTKNSSVALPPLRKVLTKADVADFMSHISPKPHLTANSSVSRLKKKNSKLSLAPSINVDRIDENTTPLLQRRASADDKTKAERRSPSPPAYATKRQKKPTIRGEVTKDFFTRQSEWLSASPSPALSPTVPQLRQLPKTNNARLRRPPSVPTDLRSKARVTEQRLSKVTPAGDLASTEMTTEQISAFLRAYKKRLEETPDDIDLEGVEADLESMLEIVKQKIRDHKHSSGLKGPSSAIIQKPKPQLDRSWTADAVVNASYHKTQSNSTTTSETGSPTIISNNSTSTSCGIAEPEHNTGLDVNGLSTLMERAKLTGA